MNSRQLAAEAAKLQREANIQNVIDTLQCQRSVPLPLYVWDFREAIRALHIKDTKKTIGVLRKFEGVQWNTISFDAQNELYQRIGYLFRSVPEIVAVVNEKLLELHRTP